MICKARGGATCYWHAPAAAMKTLFHPITTASSLEKLFEAQVQITTQSTYRTDVLSPDITIVVANIATPSKMQAE